MSRSVGGQSRRHVGYVPGASASLQDWNRSGARETRQTLHPHSAANDPAIGNITRCRDHRRR